MQTNIAIQLNTNCDASNLSSVIFAFLVESPLTNKSRENKLHNILNPAQQAKVIYRKTKNLKWYSMVEKLLLEVYL